MNACCHIPLNFIVFCTRRQSDDQSVPFVTLQLISTVLDVPINVWFRNFSFVVSTVASLDKTSYWIVFLGLCKISAFKVLKLIMLLALISASSGTFVFFFVCSDSLFFGLTEFSKPSFLFFLCWLETSTNVSFVNSSSSVSYCL